MTADERRLAAIREEYMERAAIREYLGGLKRGVAELEARRDMAIKYGRTVAEGLR